MKTRTYVSKEIELDLEERENSKIHIFISGELVQIVTKEELQRIGEVMVEFSQED